MRWDPNKKHPGGKLFLWIGSWTHCFTILFSHWFSITTTKNPIVPNQKKTDMPHQSYFFIWGSFSNGKKGLYTCKIIQILVLLFFTKLESLLMQTPIIHLPQNTLDVQRCFDVSLTYPGWWLTYPSEKYESRSSVGMMKFPTEWKVIKIPWFQTTNQLYCYSNY